MRPGAAACGVRSGRPGCEGWGPERPAACVPGFTLRTGRGRGQRTPYGVGFPRPPPPRCAAPGARRSPTGPRRRGAGVAAPAPARPPLRAPPARCWGPEGSGAGTGLAEDGKREALLVGFARPPGQPCPGCGWGVGRIGFGKWEAKLGLSLAAHLLLLFHSRPFPSQPAS